MYSADEGSLSHYQVLGADPSSDYTEIRRKYRAAALALHPDRSSASCLNEKSDDSEYFTDHDHLSIGASSVDFHHRIRELDVEYPAKLSAPGKYSGPDLFLRVQKAWEILRDPESRARYDKFLSAQRVAHQQEEISKVIGEEVFFEEMNVSEGDEGPTVEYTYPCRCGDYFVISLEELKEARYTESSGGTLENRDMAEQSNVHMDKVVQRQQSSLLLPCLSCSLHIRLHFESRPP